MLVLMYFILIYIIVRFSYAVDQYVQPAESKPNLVVVVVVVIAVKW